MEVARIRALVRIAAAHKREEKGKKVVTSSTPKVIGNGAPKCKADGKEDHPPKKGKVTAFTDKQLKRSLPSKQGHGASKSLMTSTSPVCYETHHRDGRVDH